MEELVVRSNMEEPVARLRYGGTCSEVKNTKEMVVRLKYGGTGSEVKM